MHRPSALAGTSHHLPALILAIFAELACGGAAPAAAKDPPKACETKAVKVALSAGTRLNASGNGQGRSVLVRVYLMKNGAKLRNATFDDVWQNDVSLLGSDLVKVDEYTLFPNESKLAKVEPTNDAMTIAVVALFREPTGKTWFRIYDLDPPRKTPPCPSEDPRLLVWLDGMQVEDGQGHPSDDSAQIVEPDRAAPTPPRVNGN